MLFNQGDKVSHDITKLKGVIESRGHYPDTVFIAIEPIKAGELPRQIAVYLKHLTKAD